MSWRCSAWENDTWGSGLRRPPGRRRVAWSPGPARGAVSAGSRHRRSTLNARGGGPPRLRERSRDGRELSEAALPQARDAGGRADGPLSGVWGSRSVRVAPGRGTAASVVLGYAVRDVRGPGPDTGFVAPSEADRARCVTASFPVMVTGAPATSLCSHGGCRGVTIQSGPRPSSRTPERRGDPGCGKRPLRPPERARFHYEHSLAKIPKGKTGPFCVALGRTSGRCWSGRRLKFLSPAPCRGGLQAGPERSLTLTRFAAVRHDSRVRWDGSPAAARPAGPGAQRSRSANRTTEFGETGIDAYGFRVLLPAIVTQPRRAAIVRMGERRSVR
jgi:hypothetical protein